MANLTSNPQKRPLPQVGIKSTLANARLRLRDACNVELALCSRFELAWSAAHDLAWACLYIQGGGSEPWHSVFHHLKDAGFIDKARLRLVEQCHVYRNSGGLDASFEEHKNLLVSLLLVAFHLQRQIDMGEVNKGCQST